jgi:hypothetical protein
MPLVKHLRTGAKPSRPPTHTVKVDLKQIPVVVGRKTPKAVRIDALRWIDYIK